MIKEQLRDLIQVVAKGACGYNLGRGIKAGEKWILENLITPQVVGLSDEQIIDLASELALASDGLCTFYEQEVKGWLSKQTFEASKSQPFEPSWDDAPAGTDYYELNYSWFNKFGNLTGCGVLEHIERPNPPTPSVEVGQVWKDRKEIDGITVIGLGKNKVYDTIAYQYTESKVIEIRCSDDFLSKFEKV